jgi:hypothetical protein
MGVTETISRGLELERDQYVCFFIDESQFLDLVD